MSISSRPVSLQALIVLKRAQAARERMEASVPPAPRRSGFSIARLFAAGAEGSGDAEEMEPRRLAA
jgi:hypothetical protein